VSYRQQCGGTDCLQREVEGYYVPLGGYQSDPTAGLFDNGALTAPFHKGGDNCVFSGSPRPESPLIPELPPDRIEALRTVVESIPYWSDADASGTEREHLILDQSRLTDLAEAWVPVLTPDGPGILTWPNCD
jgi:hypothetical protein